MTMAMWGSRHRDALLRIPRSTWREMVRGLRRRGDGKRESGAFLMARQDGDRRDVVRVVYLDDLDPNCLVGKHIDFNGLAYSKLWDLCEAENLTVVGDVHTHDADWVDQSDTDSANPMVAQDGHVAMIFPFLATKSIRLRAIGVHLYRGADGWLHWFGRDAERRIHLRWFR
jgi:hypothetical protein